MLNHSQELPEPKPKFITMKDSFGNVEEIPVEQENVVTFFKAMGYHEVVMTEADDGESDQ